MNWDPNDKGVEELISLFKESKGSSNEKHREIAEKINTYSKTKQFSNYLVYILNNKDIDLDVRQISGLTLKGIMERQFHQLDEDELKYFKENIGKCYLDNQPMIRKAISNLVNTFIRIGGIEIWPEILNILYENLNNDIGVNMSLETLNIIIEDSGNVLEEKYKNFIDNLSPILTNYIESIYSKSEKEVDSQLVNLVLSTVFILLENCSDSMSEYVDKIAMVLINMKNCKNTSTRYRIGRCLLSIIRVKKDVLINFRKVLFSFFSESLYKESYEMNFIAAEFFLFVLEEEKGELVKKPDIYQELSNILKKLLPYILHYTRLTPNDMCALDVENKEYCNKDKLQLDEEDEEKLGDELDEECAESYNPSWTLRKCCSKILDKLSNEFPETTFEVLKPYLENEIQHSDWIVKERSILVLGAIGIGSYDYLKQHLNNLLRYLIGELVHKNKLVRAISCWTISRFYNFFINDNPCDNKEELFRSFLSELVKRFLDKENIVQEAACTAFNSLIQFNKEKITPYLVDILRIISSVIEKYQGNSLLALYDTIMLLSENFEDEFKNLDLVKEVLMCPIKKWLQLIEKIKMQSKSKIKNEEVQFLSTDVTNVVFFDLIGSIIRSCGSIIENYLEDFIEGSLLVIKYYSEDKDIVCKSLDLISVLCQVFTERIRQSQNKIKIVETIFHLLEYDNDISTKQYTLALIGDICKVDTNLLYENINPLIEILTNHIQVLDFKNGRSDINLISVCNNSCWTLGILAITFNEKICHYVERIMEALLKIIRAPKLNKALAQNISICIGRLSLASPEKVSCYIEFFIKQFCMSLKSAGDSIEKQEAFNGVCKAIILNPQGVVNHFAFFCDAVCAYDNAPEVLENLFQNIILSYKNSLRENWNKLFNLFPEKLKNRMNYRFVFLNN